MNIYHNILFAILFLYPLDIANGQSNNKVDIGLSAELLNGRPWGGVASFSGEINYSLNKIYSITGLYRRGSGFGHFGAVEHRPEMDDDVSTYNEISSLLNYNFDDSFLGLYLGCGIGLLWGNKENGENYFIVGIPIVIGSKIQIFNSFKFGLRFIGNINTKITFTGVGLNLFFNIL